jgi:hypothetical protein
MLTSQINAQVTTSQMRSSELMLRVLGMVPPNFQLRPFYLKLLTEQVAGYYDPKARAFFTANWVDAGAQKLVMLHELDARAARSTLSTCNASKWPRGDSDRANLQRLPTVRATPCRRWWCICKAPFGGCGTVGLPTLRRSLQAANKSTMPTLSDGIAHFSYERGVAMGRGSFISAAVGEGQSRVHADAAFTEHNLTFDSYLKREIAGGYGALC